MKKLLLSIILLSLSFFAFSQAQFKGIPFNKAVPIEDLMEMEDGEELLFSTLVKVDADSIIIYIHSYEVKAKGYYDALKKLNEILEANNIKRSADIDDSYFRSHVDEADYNDVAYELSMEKGWIERTWYVYDNQWKIFMSANDEIIMVSVIHFKL